MPELRIYDLFISHAWKYGDDYTRLVHLLDNAPYFRYRDFSAPKDAPLVDPDTPVGKNILRQKMDDRVRRSQCVLVIGGMYAHNRYWMDEEMAFAEYYNKPMIGVVPWGQLRLPEAVFKRCHWQVRWNTEGIVQCIRENALHA